jgi:hypothetical protein
MNSNRLVLRPTQNRLPLQNVSSQKISTIEIINKTKLITNSILHQQENLAPTLISNKTTRPILTAIRSIKQYSKDDTHMLISPMVKTIITDEQKLSVLENNKTREQLEQELYEL